jgi:hypothetical protein
MLRLKVEQMPARLLAAAVHSLDNALTIKGLALRFRRGVSVETGVRLLQVTMMTTIGKATSMVPTLATEMMARRKKKVKTTNHLTEAVEALDEVAEQVKGEDQKAEATARVVSVAVSSTTMASMTMKTVRSKVIALRGHIPVPMRAILIAVLASPDRSVGAGALALLHSARCGKQLGASISARGIPRPMRTGRERISVGNTAS